MKETIAAALIAMSILNISAPYKAPVKPQDAPRADFLCIDIHDTILTRKDVEVKLEAEKAEAAQKEREAKLADGRIMTVLATAYAPTGNPTATGVMPSAGQTIAVDPRVIPLGSHVLINGKEYIAQDTGGLIKGNRIDIFMDSEAECVNFGAQYIEVEVLK